MLINNNFSVEIKTDIISMNPFFVDIFEDYFVDKIDFYKELLNSNNKENILDELLIMKEDILKYAYTDPYVSEKDYEKVLVVKDFVDKYFDLKLSINDEKNKVKTKSL